MIEYKYSWFREHLKKHSTEAIIQFISNSISKYPNENDISDKCLIIWKIVFYMCNFQQITINENMVHDGGWYEWYSEFMNQSKKRKEGRHSIYILILEGTVNSKHFFMCEHLI